MSAETESVAEPGTSLRAAREALGLTEQQAAEQLNLDVSALAALERGDFAALGAPVFAKGHLRRYGALLGIPEDDLLAAYAYAQAQPEAPTLIPRARREMQPARARPRWPWVLGGVVLLVLVAGLAVYLSQWGSSRSSDVPAESSAVAIEPAPAASRPGATQDAPAVVADSNQDLSPVVADSPALPLPPGHVGVGLDFAADCWVEIYDGSGKAVLYDLGRAGSQRTIAAAAPLEVALGNAPAVTMRVNGQATSLPAAVGGGTVARFRIAADGTVR